LEKRVIENGVFYVFYRQGCLDMFKRKVYDELKKWKSDSNGKTAILLESAILFTSVFSRTRIKMIFPNQK